MSAEAVAAFVGAGVNFFALLFVAGQVAVANRQLRNAQATTDVDIRRRKRQATIDYFANTVEYRNRLAKGLPDPRDAREVERTSRRALAQGEKSKRFRSIIAYLDFYEALAVAVAGDVYDLEVLNAVDGGTFRDISRSYQPFFRAVRTSSARNSWYVELEWLGEQIVKLRGEHNYYELLARRDERTQSLRLTR
ncbi:hypothetical protein GCM10023200_19470 [Actinomycetospora chlora]|uniref:DUF4760 domain-containing protein n=1 Tax=Actinomycetospora chlora TaxID=663608 RepID=A0ABP9AUW2_9PSEU